jgi:KipI family sensor histidine kinase inhibitor
VNDVNNVNSRIRPAGDSAVVVEFEERIDRAVNDRVLALVRSIEAARFTGVRDVVPTYRSAAIYFDPLKTDVTALFARLEVEAARPGSEPVAEIAGMPIRIPVCYGPAFGPDLEEVAAFGRMDAEEVISLHCRRTYRVFMLGFLPGFAYLAGVDERIAAPRLATPRARVPAGSVGIAGTQTGVYPVESPGGWNLIGRTPVKPFDPQRTEPFLLKAGDHVEFYPVDEAAYRDLARAGSTGAEAGA